MRAATSWGPESGGRGGGGGGPGGGHCLCGPSDHTEAPGLPEQEGQKTINVTPNDRELVVRFHSHEVGFLAFFF